jgi:predicted NBD/HSP70 family sugar kinase
MKAPGKRGTARRARAGERVRRARGAPAAPTKILVLDIGGTSVKMLASGQTEARKIPSGPRLTPARLVAAVMKKCADWDYEAVSIGYPGLVGGQGPRAEPGNLGPGWVGFNYAAAFDRPVRILNDAAMQALGSYDGGRMLFLGLGTGVGSALIAQHAVVPLELGGLPWRRGRALWKTLGRKGLARTGKRVWRREVTRAVEAFSAAFCVDYVVLGGGNAKLVKDLVPGTRVGHNTAAFRGGFRLWNLPDVSTLPAEGEVPVQQPAPAEWRVI